MTGAPYHPEAHGASAPARPRRQRWYRHLLLPLALASAVGVLLTPTAGGQPLLRSDPRGPANTYAHAVQPISSDVFANDAAMRALLLIHQDRPRDPAIRRGLDGIITLLGRDSTRLRKLRDTGKVPSRFRATHQLLEQAVTALRDHYRQLRSATTTTDPATQTQALYAANGLDLRYVQLVTAHLTHYATALRSAGLDPARQP